MLYREAGTALRLFPQQVTTVPAAPHDRTLLTTSEVAREIRQHPESVRRSIREGRIPARKIGGVYYVHRDALDVPTRTPSPSE